MLASGSKIGGPASGNGSGRTESAIERSDDGTMQTCRNHARLSVAPMMDCTDRYDRAFLRHVTKHTRLYTEMIVAEAVIHGNRQRLLEFDEIEHPVALQIGGSDPKKLADAARIGEDFGYDEINLNVGCPSSRVRSGRFGACLMADAGLVGECVLAMRNAVSVPVSVKCRIGIDAMDEEETLPGFIQAVSQSGCTTFIVHARKAILKGLSPKENREIPPLRHGVVHDAKRRFPALEIVINGGIHDLGSARRHLERVDGVMIGRAAYRTPYILAEADRMIFGSRKPVPNRREIVLAWLPYLERTLAEGVPLFRVTRHILGLYHGQPGARTWRRLLTEKSSVRSADAGTVEDILGLVENSHGTREAA